MCDKNTKVALKVKGHNKESLLGFTIARIHSKLHQFVSFSVYVQTDRHTNAAKHYLFHHCSVAGTTGNIGLVRSDVTVVVSRENPTGKIQFVHNSQRTV